MYVIVADLCCVHAHDDDANSNASCARSGRKQGPVSLARALYVTCAAASALWSTAASMAVRWTRMSALAALIFGAPTIARVLKNDRLAAVLSRRIDNAKQSFKHALRRAARAPDRLRQASRERCISVEDRWDFSTLCWTHAWSDETRAATSARVRARSTRACALRARRAGSIRCRALHH